MRVAIVGGGAMGGVYGALLHDAGIDTTIVDVSPAVLQAVAAEGLRVEREGHIRRVGVPFTSEPAKVGVVDVVLFFTKCYHTQAAAEQARPMVGPHTVVASLQNGWGNGDTLAGVFPPDRLAVGVSYHSALLRAPGHVAHTAVGNTLVGPFTTGGEAAADRVGQALASADIEVSVTLAILDEIWKKLTLNAAALPTSALTRYTAGALGADEEMMALVNGLARETVAVARAEGRTVDEAERLTAIHTVLAKAGGGKASMLQDVEAGRRTEIDVINDAVVRAGARHGVPTPLNSAMVALVRGYERAVGLD